MTMPNRELFIGLGGTGGNTLRLLYKRMNDEQRRNARYVYIDTDQNDINDMREEGIRAFAISSADTVGQVANTNYGEDYAMALAITRHYRMGRFFIARIGKLCYTAKKLQ